MLSLHRVSKHFGSTRAVADISLEVADGECVVLLGPSGSGKTTLLRLIAGLDVPDEGRVCLRGVEASALPPHKRGVALVTQRAVLYPHLDVRANLLFGLPAQTPVEDAIEAFGLAGLLQRRPSQLSGGQQQRVALAHALLRQASLVLLDEPFANLDSVSRWELLVQLPLLRRRLPFTMILVTHEQAEAFALADRVALLETGRLLQVSPPEEAYARPASVRSARLLGWPPINLFPGTVRDAGGAFEVSGHRLPLPMGLSGWARFQDRATFLGVRPRSLRPGSVGWPLVSMGTMPAAEGGWRLARVAGILATLACGEGDHVFFSPQDAHLFDVTTGEALACGPV